jgi:hypothetical protein
MTTAREEFEDLLAGLDPEKKKELQEAIPFDRFPLDHYELNMIIGLMPKDVRDRNGGFLTRVVKLNGIMSLQQPQPQHRSNHHHVVVSPSSRPATLFRLDRQGTQVFISDLQTETGSTFACVDFWPGSKGKMLEEIEKKCVEVRNGEGRDLDIALLRRELEFQLVPILADHASEEEAKKEAKRQAKMEMEKQKQQQRKPKPEEVPAVAAAVAVESVELTPELTREISLEDIASILSSSIKKDDAPKLITFLAMLLAQTNEDQLNLGYQSESSAGKSYVPIEVATYFPKEEVEILASASPTAFYHDGQWDNERKVLFRNLEHRILVFLDQPHFQLLEKLRPMLSKDMKELHYKITDKNQKQGLRTKDVIIRGYPSTFFCTTKTDPDEQEKTRMILLSPSIDQEKLEESLKLVALRKGNSDEYHRQIQQDPQRQWLMNRIKGVRQSGVREVVVPDNGEGVYERFRKEHPYLLPRHQRDLPRIFAFIKAHALLNCFNREKSIDDSGRTNAIMATQVDINAGFELYKDIELANDLGLSPYLLGIYQDVFAPLLLLNNGESTNDVSREDILDKHYQVRHKTLSPETLKREIIPQLETVGLISQQPDPEDKAGCWFTPLYRPLLSLKKLQKLTAKVQRIMKVIGGMTVG